jgi:hypothetical protein
MGLGAAARWDFVCRLACALWAMRFFARSSRRRLPCQNRAAIRTLTVNTAPVVGLSAAAHRDIVFRLACALGAMLPTARPSRRRRPCLQNRAAVRTLTVNTAPAAGFSAAAHMDIVFRLARALEAMRPTAR